MIKVFLYDPYPDIIIAALLTGTSLFPFRRSFISGSEKAAKQIKIFSFFLVSLPGN